MTFKEKFYWIGNEPQEVPFLTPLKPYKLRRFVVLNLDGIDYPYEFIVDNPVENI